MTTTIARSVWVGLPRIAVTARKTTRSLRSTLLKARRSGTNPTTGSGGPVTTSDLSSQVDCSGTSNPTAAMAVLGRRPMLDSDNTYAAAIPGRWPVAMAPSQKSDQP